MDRAAPVQGVGGMGRVKPMGRNRALYPGSDSRSPHDAPRLGGLQVALPFTADEHRGIRFRLPPEPE